MPLTRISYPFISKGIIITNIEKAIKGDHTIVVTPVAYYEVKRGLLLINAVKQLKKLQDFCELFPVGRLGDVLLENAIDIYVKERRTKRNTEDADIFIAAFCIQNNYILVTDNTKHFQNIEGLRLVNWTDSALPETG